MGHVINPHLYRVGITTFWTGIGFSKKKFYDYITLDQIKLFEYLLVFFKLNKLMYFKFFIINLQVFYRFKDINIYFTLHNKILYKFYSKFSFINKLKKKFDLIFINWIKKKIIIKKKFNYNFCFNTNLLFSIFKNKKTFKKPLRFLYRNKNFKLSSYLIRLWRRLPEPVYNLFKLKFLLKKMQEKNYTNLLIKKQNWPTIKLEKKFKKVFINSFKKNLNFFLKNSNFCLNFYKAGLINVKNRKNLQSEISSFLQLTLLILKKLTFFKILKKKLLKLKEKKLLKLKEKKLLKLKKKQLKIKKLKNKFFFKEKKFIYLKINFLKFKSRIRWAKDKKIVLKTVFKKKIYFIKFFLNNRFLKKIFSKKEQKFIFIKLAIKNNIQKKHLIKIPPSSFSLFIAFKDTFFIRHLIDNFNYLEFKSYIKKKKTLKLTFYGKKNGYLLFNYFSSFKKKIICFSLNFHKNLFKIKILNTFYLKILFLFILKLKKPVKLNICLNFMKNLGVYKTKKIFFYSNNLKKKFNLFYLNFYKKKKNYYLKFKSLINKFKKKKFNFILKKNFLSNIKGYKAYKFKKRFNWKLRYRTRGTYSFLRAGWWKMPKVYYRKVFKHKYKKSKWRSWAVNSLFKDAEIDYYSLYRIIKSGIKDQNLTQNC